jgi:hypothetical protein
VPPNCKGRNRSVGGRVIFLFFIDTFVSLAIHSLQLRLTTSLFSNLDSKLKTNSQYVSIDQCRVLVLVCSHILLRSCLAQINRLGSVAETWCVSCEERTGFLYYVEGIQSVKVRACRQWGDARGPPYPAVRKCTQFVFCYCCVLKCLRAQFSSVYVSLCKCCNVVSEWWELEGQLQ